MKEIFEKRIENEVSFIANWQNNALNPKLKKTKDEAQIELTFPASLVSLPVDVNINIRLDKNFPFTPPKLFFLTKFSFPHLSDGRDFCEEILGQSWTTVTKISDIVEKVPGFISEYMKSLSEGYLLLSGIYYLGEVYEINFLESLPVFTKRIKEREMIGQKYIESNKLLLISDIYFCLFDIEKKTKTCTLSFWSNIKALITIRRISKENLLKFFWRNKLVNKKLHEVDIVVPKGEEIVSLILGKMECFGINYNISQRNIGEYSGKLPDIDIDALEKQIDDTEKDFNSKTTKTFSEANLLMEFYQKAVEYYSAINNPRFEYFKKKIHEIISSDVMKDYMDTEEAKKGIKATVEDDANRAQTTRTKSNKDKEFKVQEPTSARALHVEMSKDDDDAPVDVSSDEEEEEEEEDKKEVQNQETPKEEEKNQLVEEKIKAEDSKETEKEEDKKEKLSEEKD